MPHTRHPLADRRDVPLVHVTHFNALIWDTGRAPTTVIEHGVVDPGPLWTGELARLAVVVNEPVRRGRVVGTDLLPEFAADRPARRLRHERPTCRRWAGRGVGRTTTCRRPRCTPQLARRRVYLHPFRWTSLGLSLIEAMHLGMPVVALATTEAVEAVPPAAGACSTRMRGADRRRAAPAGRPGRGAAEAGRAARGGSARAATGSTGSCTTGTDC